MTQHRGTPLIATVLLGCVFEGLHGGLSILWRTLPVDVAVPGWH